ncbi:hypothetical protein GSI_05833 [Ganoderma sinense ZZ0214-1]|uniref:Uncharacterized protein n=1 Tax=Ganoderma sinense ZZ0214-1 TaxID=1077348 RepID=A0A2G8SBJ6_9APHY|nr:hypothetical protein GSI_05833 [Ganoderma sinense ZZ0214-1]
MSDFPLDMLPSSVTTQFPAMRSLKAELVSRFEDLGLLLRLFPNLRDTLEIKTMIPAGNDLSACRERSKEAQEAHTWPGLDHVVCSPGSAFIMALQCPIRRMDLDGKISRPEDKERLVEVLQHNSPRQLSFSLEVFGDLCDPAGLFPVEAADKLTHLSLCLSVQIECRQGCDADRNRTWTQFLDTLVDSMKHLRLTYLRIVLQYEVLRDQDPLPGGVDAGAVYFAREEDLRPAAMRFSETMPTLQYVLLTTCGYTTLLGPTQPGQHTSKWLSSKAWHIPDVREDFFPFDTERGPYPEISDEEAEAVINREELHLGSREQVGSNFQHTLTMSDSEQELGHFDQLELGSQAERDQYPYPFLNFDILRLVCDSLTDVSDVLSFSLTCSTLREGALQRRLRMSPVVLWDLDSIQRFHDFIFKNPNGRAPHIHGLKLPDFEYDFQMDYSWFKSINGCLAALLEAAIHLEYLYLPSTEFQNIVLGAVQKLTTLRQLSMGSHFNIEYTFKLLTTSRSPIRYLYVDAYEILNLPASFLHRHMAHLAPTLETLELDDLTLDISPLSVTTQFTALRRLKAQLICPLDRLEVLLRLFPNLDNSLVLSYPGSTLSPDAYAEVRERNKEAQNAHTWPCLDRLACDDDVAFMLALRCPIRLMDIPHVSLPLGKRYLVETLRYNCPQQLHLGLLLCDGLDGLDGLFPLEAADRLTHLLVFARVQMAGNNYSLIPWDQVLDGLLHSMQHLRTTHLRIVLHYSIHPGPGDPQTEAQPNQHRSLYAASDGDLHRAAARFFSSMPALQYLFLTTCGYVANSVERAHSYTCQRLASRAWCAVSADTEVTVTDPHLSGASAERGPCAAISGDEAETIMDREELRLGSREEAMVKVCYEPGSALL